MQIEPIAYFRSPFASKFGIPKQSGLAPALRGSIVFERRYRDRDSLRGLEGFDYIWLLWGFSANKHDANSPVVRPPVLGGNERVGVFATRSPFRPNSIGLSSVRICSIEEDAKLGWVINVAGADLMDGTPIYDIKPYVAYTDSHEDARCGFAQTAAEKHLHVVIPERIENKLGTDLVTMLRQVLELDPRPQYHDDKERIYGMPFAGMDVRFKVDDRKIIVVDLVLKNNNLG